MKKYFVFAFLLAPFFVFAQDFDTDLYFGLTNNTDVIKLQEFLTDQGLYEGPISGNFFSLTLRGVKNFQAREGIVPAAGYFGPKTRIQANALLAKSVDASNNQAVLETGTTSLPILEQQNKQNDATMMLIQQIKILQEQLNQLVHQTKSISSSSSVTIPETPSVPAVSNDRTNTSLAPVVPITPSVSSPVPTPSTPSATLATTTPVYLLSPFNSSLKVSVLSNSDTSQRTSIHLFDFRLLDDAPSPYSNTGYAHAPNEEIQVRRLRLTKVGTIGGSDISTIRLMNLDTGYILATNTAPVGGAIEFTLSVDASKPDYGVMVSWHSYGVVASVATSSAGTLQYQIASVDDINAYDYRNDTRVATVTNINTFPIVGFSVGIATVPTTISPPPSPPTFQANATTTILLWNNVTVTSDETDGQNINAKGYTKAEFNFTWQGSPFIHDCQFRPIGFATQDGVPYNGTFYGSGCTQDILMNVLNNSVRVDAWTSPNGILNGTLMLYP